MKPGEATDDTKESNDITPVIEQFAHRLQTGIKRKEVVLGKDRMFRLLKNKMVALIWVTEDLSKHSYKKLCDLSRDYRIPMLRYGVSTELGRITGQSSTKVYLIKKSFSGVNHLMRKLKDIIEYPPD